MLYMQYSPILSSEFKLAAVLFVGNAGCDDTVLQNVVKDMQFVLLLLLMSIETSIHLAHNAITQEPCFNAASRYTTHIRSNRGLLQTQG